MAILGQEEREEAMQQRIEELETNLQQTSVNLIRSTRLLKVNALTPTLHDYSPKNEVRKSRLKFDNLKPIYEECRLTSLSQGEAFHFFDDAGIHANSLVFKTRCVRK